VTIVEFIKARLDEDEAAARAASAGGAWRYEDGDSVGAWTLYDEHWTIASLKTYQHEAYDYAARMPAFRHPEYVDADANGAHIARHDPARVLREVEAKRRILDRYDDALARQGDWQESQLAADICVQEYQDWVLPTLALPYADHPDYDPTWSPT
jgi:hypothetical protein